MFILSYTLIAILLVYAGLGVFLYKFTQKRFSDRKYIPKLIAALFVLLPTYDIIMTNLLGGYYCLTTSETFINKTVEHPDSIYWEDNVYPGFNEADRKLMIRNYLDGIHLKTMALNGDDGKVYVYKVVSLEYINQIASLENRISTIENKLKNLYPERKKLAKLEKHLYRKDISKMQLDESELLISFGKDEDGVSRTFWVIKTETLKLLVSKISKLEEERNNVSKQIMVLSDKHLETCLSTEQIYTIENMPNLNYTVTFNEVKLNFFSRNFLYSDITEITDNTTNEVVAQNHRMMKLLYNITPRLRQIYYDPEPMCGYQFYRGFDGEIFIKLQCMYGGEVMNKIGLNEKLYKKYILGGK